MKKFPPFEVHKKGNKEYKVIKYPKLYVVVETTFVEGKEPFKFNYKIMKTLANETMSELKQKAYDKFDLNKDTLVSGNC